MPSDFLQIDSAFPTPQPGETLEKRVEKLTNYAYMLVEQLRYTLYNLDIYKNMNPASLNRFMEPIAVALSSLDGDMTQIKVEAGKISSTVASLSGEFSRVQQTVNGLEIQTEDGVSYITGDKIISGTIEGVDLISYDRSTGGIVNITDGYVGLGLHGMDYGMLYFDDDNSRVYLTTLWMGLKIEAQGANMSIDAGDSRTIYIGSSNTDERIVIGDSVGETSRVDLYGDIRVNGQTLDAYIAEIAGGGSA